MIIFVGIKWRKLQSTATVYIGREVRPVGTGGARGGSAPPNNLENHCN